MHTLQLLVDGDGGETHGFHASFVNVGERSLNEKAVGFTCDESLPDAYNEEVVHRSVCRLNEMLKRERDIT